MSWIKTNLKPTKICVENPDFPLSEVFQGYDWKTSMATKQLGILCAILILANNVDTVIEIGCAKGFSSAILAKALCCNTENGLLISIDSDPNAIKDSKKATQNIGIEHIHITIDSKLVNYQAILKERKVGLSFIDGDHTYEYVRHDMYACYDILKPFGFLALHDYNQSVEPGVYRAVNDFISETGCPMFFLDENKESADYKSAIIQKRGIY